jgi:hypothetical protein
MKSSVTVNYLIKMEVPQSPLERGDAARQKGRDLGGSIYIAYDR